MSIRELAELVSTFNSPTASNDQKRAIDAQLRAFMSHPMAFELRYVSGHARREASPKPAGPGFDGTGTAAWPVRHGCGGADVP